MSMDLQAQPNQKKAHMTSMGGRVNSRSGEARDWKELKEKVQPEGKREFGGPLLLLDGPRLLPCYSSMVLVSSSAAPRWCASSHDEATSGPRLTTWTGW